MKPLTFKVSAKAARLLGRENASNAEAAISELIKNTYDADATTCFVCFVPKYQSAPNQITIDEYRYLFRRNRQIEQFYKIKNNEFACLRDDNGEAPKGAYALIKQLLELFIIDNGSGMSAKTIEECWMVIGTNDKEMNIISQMGRARTGAKGIGRFALDRLGTQCTLYSSTRMNGKMHSIRWEVDWSEFDGEGKVLDEISARLDENAKPLSEALTILDQFPQMAAAAGQTEKSTKTWATGTAIKIGLLRDDWNRRNVNHLNQTLGALIPPTEQKELNLYLFDASSPDQYGLVVSDILDDYDYRLDVDVVDVDNVHFRMYRNELSTPDIDSELFSFSEMQGPHFGQSALSQKMISYQATMETLFPSESDQFFRLASELGPFKIQLLFFKKGTPSRRDSEIYPYRPFQPGPRRAWLDEFGGIKIYRDNFAVRPYGELDGRAFDWLALGQRVAVSPVAASRRGWKVSPQNLAGTVMISRAANARLYDQTNREGIIENEHFAVFRTIILRAIREFEDDRSTIHYNLNELHKQKNKAEEAKEVGAVAATRVTKDPNRATAEDAKQLARAFVAQQEEIQELRDEQTMLRALATLGTVLLSFSHEMGQLQNTMGSRSKILADILTSYISADEVADVSQAFHPYKILEEWEEDDQRVKQWFTFALTTVRAGRRRRREISLREHLEGTKIIWLGFLEPRGVELLVEFEDDDSDAKVLAFEIDLDSIFNNLILNSVEAFLSSRHTGARRIRMGVFVEEHAVRVRYQDNGPGLHPSIRDPAHIFHFATSTKRDPDGEPAGTGLGMWILSTVVQGYGGSCKAYRNKEQEGFQLELSLPTVEGAR